MRKRVLCALLALAAGVSALTGCEKKPERVESTTFAMDTVMQLTLYAEDTAGAQAFLGELSAELAELDGQLSATKEDSVISQINGAGGQPVELEAPIALLLGQALTLCHLTDGALDITACPAVKAWGFTTGEHRIPDDAELAELAANIDYTAVKLAGDAVTLPAGMEMDLGAVAKGFAGDLLAADVRENHIASALLNLGQSTIVAVGTKPEGEPWRVALQNPAGGDALGVVELADLAMGTSGGYQRFFEQDGVTYWHILDPDTAAPAGRGLGSVTVVSPSALTCDGLSTALFVMGLEEGSQFWRNHPELEFEVIFVTEEGGIYCTAGLADRFTPIDREVTVLE